MIKVIQTRLQNNINNISNKLTNIIYHFQFTLKWCIRMIEAIIIIMVIKCGTFWTINSVYMKDAGGRNRVSGFLFPLACGRQLLRYGASSLDAALVNDVNHWGLCRLIFIEMDEGAEISVTIAQVVQRLRGTHLHSQLEKQVKVSRLA